MMDRRNFLKQTSVVSASILLTKPGNFLIKPSNLKVGLQLYSLREYIAKDPKGVMAHIAKAGYTELETYGYDAGKKTYFGMTAKDFSSLLKDNGITSPSGHYNQEQFLSSGKEDELQSCMEAANALGETIIVIPYLADRFRKTPDDVKKLSQNINKMAEICKTAGFRVAYHNHNFEFKPVDGVMLYDVMLKETDPKLVDFEMDIYWVVRGGQDPVKLIEAHPGRFKMWHIKDMDKEKPNLNTEIGSGSIDFKKIFEYQKKSGVEHIFMEQENFAMDGFASITQSASYIKNTLLK